MRTKLTDAEVQHYDEQGFVKLERLLSPDDLVFLGRKAREHRAAAEGEGLREVTDPRDDQPIFDIYYNLWSFDEETRAFTASLGDVFAALLGGTRTRVWSDRVFVKRSESVQTPWHQDAVYWPLNTNRTATMWIAMSPTTASTGALRFVPGSHRVTTRKLQERFNDLAEIRSAFPSLRDVPVETVPLLPGDCTVHSGAVLHGSHPNVEPGERLSYACSVMPEHTQMHAWEDIDDAKLKFPRSYYATWPNETDNPRI